MTLCKLARIAASPAHSHPCFMPCRKLAGPDTAADTGLPRGSRLQHPVAGGLCYDDATRRHIPRPNPALDIREIEIGDIDFGRIRLPSKSGRIQTLLWFKRPPRRV